MLLALAFYFAMILKQCTKCGKPTHNRAGVCDQCKPETARRKREQYSAYDRKRDSTKVKFYHSAAWKAVRVQVLERAHYQCQDCLQEVAHGLLPVECVSLATEVHHEVPLSISWERRLDVSNLTALCAKHHKLRDIR